MARPIAGRMLQAVPREPAGEHESWQLRMAAQDGVVIERRDVVVAAPGALHLQRFHGRHAMREARPDRLVEQGVIDVEVLGVGVLDAPAARCRSRKNFPSGRKKRPVGSIIRPAPGSGVAAIDDEDQALFAAAPGWRGRPSPRACAECQPARADRPCRVAIAPPLVKRTPSMRPPADVDADDLVGDVGDALRNGALAKQLHQRGRIDPAFAGAAPAGGAETVGREPGKPAARSPADRAARYRRRGSCCSLMLASSVARPSGVAMIR